MPRHSTRRELSGLHDRFLKLRISTLPEQLRKLVPRSKGGDKIAEPKPASDVEKSGEFLVNDKSSLLEIWSFENSPNSRISI